MKGLATLDYAVVILYLAAIGIVGSSFYKRRSTAREYFLGGRSMPWLAVGISIIAADLSAITVMGTPAWAYSHNLELMWNSAGYLIAAPIVILVFVPFYSRLNLYTAYEYLERRFDLKVRLLTSVMFLTLRCMHVAVVIYAPSLMFHLLTGLPVWQCIASMGAFTTIYTALGGVRAVIWTDVIQFTAVMTGLIVILIVSLAGTPSLTAAWHVAQEAGRLKSLNFSTDPNDLTSIWAALFGGIVLCMAPLTTDQALLQRLFTTKSSEDCRRSIVTQAVLIMPITLLLFTVGIALFAFYNFHPDRLAGMQQPDEILPLFAVRELPVGVSGLVVACIFSASIGVMSAGINALTTASTIDFYQRVWRPGAASTHYGLVGRLGTVFWGAMATFCALFANRLGDLALSYNRVSSVLSGPMLGIFLLGTITRRATATGVVVGALSGAIAIGIVSATTNWSFFYYGPIGVLMTLGVGYGTSLAMPPPPEAKLYGLVVGYGDPALIAKPGEAEPAAI